MYDNMSKEDFQNVAITSGAMTQPFAANADNVLRIDVLLPSAVPTCSDPANPASMRSRAANITNTLESAEAPVSKFNQVVKTQVHAMSELGNQSSDALGMFSEYLTNLAAYKCSVFAQEVSEFEFFGFPVP